MARRVLVLLTIAVLLLPACGSGPTRKHRLAVEPTRTTTTAGTPAHATSTTTAKPSSPTNFDPLALSAISTTHWWVVGMASCGQAPCLQVATTSDAGVHWETYGGPIITGPIPEGGYLPEVAFVDALHGWIAAAYNLYRTDDDGRTWVPIDTGGSVYQLEASNGVGYISVQLPCVPGQSSTAPGSCTVEEMMTIAAGQSRPTPLPATLKALNGGFAVDGNVIVANATTNGSVAVSDDGGQTFVTSAGLPGILCSFSIPRLPFVWALCSGGHMEAPSLSFDGGRSFASLGIFSNTGIPGECPNGGGIAGVSGSTAIMACGIGPLYHLTNEGADVNKGLDPPTSNGSWSIVGFTTPEVGYVIWIVDSSQTSTPGVNQLWRTTDGGVSWRRVAVP